MLFNSYTFIYIFIPSLIVLSLVFKRGQLWILLGFSLVFYAVNSWLHVLLLLGLSVSVYYLSTWTQNKGKHALVFAIILTLSPLLVFKYFDFVSSVLGVGLTLDLVLPLGISFFTFQLLAYLIDFTRGGYKQYSFRNFLLFVSFFPQLIAGPIVHHKDFLPQLNKVVLNKTNLLNGFCIFSIGFFKKVVLADQFGPMVSLYYEGIALDKVYHSLDHWLNTLAYTLQIYFDFSGYCDMAIGLALVFNLRLPVNFNSPYKSGSLVDFWRRWHVTLSRFLRDYVYIPLGGGRVPALRKKCNLVLTMLIGGFWHGAGWNFILWGFIHGLALSINHFFRERIRLPRGWGVMLTFLFVHLAWVLFRAENLCTAKQIYKGLLMLEGVVLPVESQSYFSSSIFRYQGNFHGTPCVWIALGLAIIFLFPNSNRILEKIENQKWHPLRAVLFTSLFTISVFNCSDLSEFLYYRF